MPHTSAPEAIAIEPSQLVPGLFVWLDLKWLDHPFLSNRFLLKNPQDITLIQNLPVQGKLYYLPARSTAEPLQLNAPGPSHETEAERARAEALERERQLMARARQERIRAIKDTAARTERAWENAASSTRETLHHLARSPRVAGRALAQLSKDTAAAIEQGPEALLHLLGTKDDRGPQFHALNVMTLCMLVGKKVGLSEREMSDLAMAALAHDAGKWEIPHAILKNSHRKPHEEDFYRQHVQFSVKLAKESGAFNSTAIAMIADHHEHVDGSGWPRGRTDMSTGARILAMANRYDRLCAPEAPGTAPMMPSEALAHMLRQEGAWYDASLLGTLIKLLGVYPPGTVVKLSNQQLALVVSPGTDIRRPRLLVYDPDAPEAEAPMLNLAREPGLTIVQAIRPSELAPEVLQWLNPQQRLACYFSAEDEDTG